MLFLTLSVAQAFTNCPSPQCGAYTNIFTDTCVSPGSSLLLGHTHGGPSFSECPSGTATCQNGWGGSTWVCDTTPAPPPAPSPFGFPCQSPLCGAYSVNSYAPICVDQGTTMSLSWTHGGPSATDCQTGIALCTELVNGDATWECDLLPGGNGNFDGPWTTLGAAPAAGTAQVPVTLGTAQVPVTLGASQHAAGGNGNPSCPWWLPAAYEQRTDGYQISCNQAAGTFCSYNQGLNFVCSGYDGIWQLQGGPAPTPIPVASCPEDEHTLQRGTYCSTPNQKCSYPNGVTWVCLSDGIWSDYRVGPAPTPAPVSACPEDEHTLQRGTYCSLLPNQKCNYPNGVTWVCLTSGVWSDYRVLLDYSNGRRLDVELDEAPEQLEAPSMD